jgi:radical SAM-linked protein
MTEGQGPKQRLRIKFGKGAALKYISHLDLTRTWERVFRRAGLPIAYSQGFNPRPRFQIAAALPVGVTGWAEVLDAWFTDSLAPETVVGSLRSKSPTGLEILAVEQVDLKDPSLQSQMLAAGYKALIQSQEPKEAIELRIQELMAAPTLLRQRHHKGKVQTYDLRPWVQELAVQGMGQGLRELTMRLQASPQGAARPDAVLDALGLSLAPHTVERTNLFFQFDK